MSQVATMLLIGAALAVVAGLFIWLMTKLSPTGGLFGTLAGGTLPAAKGPSLRHNFTLDEMRALDEAIEEVGYRSGKTVDSARVRQVVEYMLTHPEADVYPSNDQWDEDIWNTFRQALGVRWY